MEGLAYDFGVEDDSDDDDKEKKPKKRYSLSAEIVKEPEVKLEEPTKDFKEKPFESFEQQQIDNAPELDTEAPLEHLSRVEIEAISQAMAQERLAEMREQEAGISSETLAAESFLENVEVGGDIEVAYSETLAELGETAEQPLPEGLAAEIEVETAEPVDPASLVEDAKSELSPDVSYTLNKRAESRSPYSKPEVKPLFKAKKSAEKHPSKIFDGIVDYVVGRRFTRISAEQNHEQVEHKLSNEVGLLRNEIASRETVIRQIARNKVFEKPAERVKPAKAETIGKVLINSEMPLEDQATPNQAELAGISAHTMNHSELVKVAEGIAVEGGNSLRQVYDAHLVGEKGLRRIVAEYLRGGNFKKSLKRELLEREKDFERDPKLRDQGSILPITSSHVELADLLHRSGIDWSEPQLIMPKQKVKPSNLPAFLEDIKSPGNPVRRAVDIVLVSVIFTLALVITILILSR